MKLFSDDRFKLKVTDDKIDLELARILTEDDVVDELYLFIIIEALRESVVVGNTLVSIKVPIKETSVAINVFERAIYRGIVTSELLLQVAQIGLNTIDDGINLNFELSECK